MSKAQKVAKLEALLARIQTRAAEPRVSRVELGSAVPPAEVQVVADAQEDVETMIAPVRHQPAMTDPEIVMEVEVQASTQDAVLAVPVEETLVPEALESRERLVAAEPVAPEPATVETIAPGAIEDEPTVAIAVEPEPPPELTAEAAELISEEDIEEAPVSSRRAVAAQPEERLAEMAFGAEEPRPPRHTPPPESGRLPAAPAAEYDGDVTGVREAPKPEIVPEVTLADVAASDVVADVLGQPKPLAPPTFLAALDASLAL
jgi:hypothetical protein